MKPPVQSLILTSASRLVCMANPDRLAPILEHFRVRTRLFNTGPLCGVTTFPAHPGRGFLHVLRRGEMDTVHRNAGGTPQRLSVDQPSLIFYPHPLEHTFHSGPSPDDSDFACATLDIDGGPTHPLLDALPPAIVIPLDDAHELEPTLDLLFAEIDNVRCGNRAIADRLFEVVLIRFFRWLLDHPDDIALTTGLICGLADERLARALTAIHESPAEPWTLNAMAERAGMSRSAFAAHFKQTVGQTPASYLTDWRITLAQTHLLAGASITRTATDVGYATTPAFTRAFSTRMGCPPRAWLKSAGADLEEPLPSTSA